LLWLAAWIGASRFARVRKQVAQANEDFRVIQAATLTLLALIIGFTFSMALERYDQRKNYEEAETNTIGTQYLRTDLLPPAEASEMRALLAAYVQERVRFYTATDESVLNDINNRTARLQDQLWATVVAPSLANPTPVQALVVSGMNDVLSAQTSVQAAWWNRIPLGAWGLMGAIALCCNVLIGYGVRDEKQAGIILLILPFIVSISFALIADVDSPRQGVIRVVPQNVQALAASLRPR
jgi:hypothetical protein